MIDEIAPPNAPPIGNVTFKVRFRPQKVPFSGQTNWLELTGRGEIEFAADSIYLRGKRNEFFGFGSAANVTFQRHQIVNVVQSGKLLRFDVPTPEQPTVAVQFQTAGEDIARTIAAALPDTVTEAAARTIAEAKDFESRLQSVGSKARVTLALVALNVLVFVFLSIKGAGVFVPDGDVAVRWGSNFGPMTLGGQWWRLLTSMFIHFGIFHLALNMFALYQAGCLVERMYGSAHFLLLYLFAGVSGSVASLLWHPSINSAGASGAIFGVFGGLLVFMLDKRNRVPMSVMATTRNSALAFIGYNLLNGFSHAGIDNAAHLGGLVGGALMGFMLARPLDVAQRRAPLPRLVGASLLGVLLLGSATYVFFPSDGPALQELKFQQALIEFAPKEANALGAYSEIVKRLQAGTLDRAGAAHEIEFSIIPQWDKLYDSLSAAKLAVDSKRLDVQHGLTLYCDFRRKHLRLVSAALRTGDPRIEKDAAQTLEQVQAQIETVKRVAKAR